MNPIVSSLRVFRQAPGFAATVIATLSLGVSAVGLAWVALDGALLHPLDLPESDRLVTVYSDIEIMQATGLGVSLPLYLDLTDRFEGAVFGAYQTVRRNLESDSPARVTVAETTPSLFEVLAVGPELGSGFSEEGSAEAMLSHSFWRSNYGSDPGVIGRRVPLDGVVHEIVGVMRADFGFPSYDVDLWTSLIVPRTVMDIATLRGDHRLTVIGRLADETGSAQAQLATDRFNRWINGNVPNYSPEAGFSISVHSLGGELTAATRPAVLLLATAAIVVLVIVTANVANLLSFRTESRVVEFLVRISLGAEWGRILCQLVWESSVLTIAGGLAALPLIAMTVAGIESSLSGLAGPAQLRLDLTTVLLVLAASALLGVLLGAMTHRQLMARKDVRLGAHRGSTFSRGTRIFNDSLVVAQVALSFVLVAGSGLLFQSYRSLKQVDAGFRSDNITALTLALPEVRYDVLPSVDNFARQLVAIARSVPGVRSAAVSDFLPMRDVGEEVPFWLEQRVAGVEPIIADVQFAGDGYFEAAGIDLTAGRGFVSSDIDGALPVVIVNQRAADLHFDGNPIGRRIEVFQDGVREVIGVAGDVRLRSLEAPVRPQIYLPLSQFPPGELWRGDLMRLLRELTLVVRTDGDPQPIVSGIRAGLGKLDPLIPISSVVRVSEVLEGSLAARGTLLSVLGLFAVGALILGAVGVYSVLAFAVSRRRREMGIRISLGATTGDVMRVVTFPAVSLVAAGALIGLLITGAASRWISSFLVGVTALDPIVMLASFVAVVGLGAAAGAVPARRASRVDPVEILREE